VSVYYQDEAVTLYHGDCREVTEWLNADVLVTDPPYGYSHKSSGGGSAATWANRSIANDEDTSARDETLSLWGSRPALVFGSWKSPKPRDVRTVLVWDKGLAHGMGDLSIPWKPNWEEVYVLGSGFLGSRDSGVILGHTQVSWESKGKAHPHQKPQSLMGYLLTKCPPGTVADPFAGSGSTLVAAKQLGRNAIGVELEERYCEVIAKRLAQGVLDFGDAS
jgi:DNA modification methylase